ncbi:MAG: hypothetical protein NC215_00140 [Ruminococcus sp.]|nr:hypothetical protein [Ruminococcus sp.]
MSKETKEKKTKKKSKKILTAFLVIIAVIAVVAIPQRISKTVTSDLSIAKICKNEPLYAAHRGLSSLYPQNTIPAFEAAVEAGYYAFECDVHTTSDGEWVVIHNDTVDAMTNGEGEVESFTFDEIRALSIDNGNGIKNYENLKVPTLEETLSVCDGNDIIPIIELKKCDVKYFPSFIKALEEHDLLKKVVIISFTFDYLTELQKLNPDLRMMYLIKTPTKETVDMCVEHGNMGIDFYGTNLIACTGAIKYAKEKGLELGAWTIDNTLSMDVLRMAGVDLITTNRIIP